MTWSRSGDRVSTFPQRIAGLSYTSQGVRRTQRALMLAIATLGALACLRIPTVQHDAARAIGILVDGDGDKISAYVRSFGVWAPIASLDLMVLPRWPRRFPPR